VRRFRWWWAPAVAFFALMVFNVQDLLRAAPPTRPDASDREAARRTASSPRGVIDEREDVASPEIVSGPGVIEPAAPETGVGAAVPGRIARIAVAEGELVAIGAPLVELDATVERAAAEATEAEVAAARAQLAQVVRGSPDEEVRAVVADAETARLRAELSRGVADRLAKAMAAGGVTRDEFERAEGVANADASTARAADARRGAVLAKARREDVQLARARLAATEARRDQALAALERLTVRSPIAGEVLTVMRRAGEYYQPGAEPLVVIGDTSTLTVRMDVDERDLGRVEVGARATVRANAYPGVEFGGRVIRLGRRMGQKRVRTDEPGERHDTKVLQVIVALDDRAGLVVGQRVTCWVGGASP